MSGFIQFKNRHWKLAVIRILEALPETRSRLVITCRKNIPDIHSSLIVHENIDGLTEHESCKLMMFCSDFEGYDHQHFKEIYRTVGGNPKIIRNLGKILRGKDVSWDTLQESLEKLNNGIYPSSLSQ